MKWSFTIARIAAIDVKVHATFFLLLAWVALLYWQQGGTVAAMMNGVVFILVLFACVVAHEFGHALTARRYGVVTRDITLLPIGGVASMESMPENPRQQIAIALAGPMVNFAIALIIYLFFLPAETAEFLIQPTDDVNNGALLGKQTFTEKLLVINLVLGIFNLLPAFPMDGGRVLRAVLSMFMPPLRATRVAASVGQGLAIVLGLLGLLGNPFLILIALFVWIGAAGEAGYAQMKSAISNVPITRAMLTAYDTIAEDASLGDVVNLTLKGSQKDFPVKRGRAIVAVLTQGDLLRGLREAGEFGVVSQYMSDAVADVKASERLDEVIDRFRNASCRILAVVRDGETIGIVNYDNVVELIALSEAMHEAADRGDQGSITPS